MGLTLSEIASVVREIEPVVVGAWVQKVFQPAPRTLVLEIRARGRTVSLLLSADPETARLHLLSRRPPNPAVPPPFCQFLRAHVQGARIEAAELRRNDRIARFRLAARRGPCSLLAQLTGRTADILLVDEQEIVLGALVQPKLIGKPYAAPVAKARAGVSEDREPAPLPSDDQPFPVSWAIEQRDQVREAESARARLRQARLVELRKAVKKAGRRVQALRADLEKAGRYREYGRYGELLKANLHLMKKGQDRITVVDYFDPELPELVLPLDPSKGPQGNMEDHFKKHRKYLSAEREIRPRLHQIEREVETLRSELAAVQQGAWEVATPASTHQNGSPVLGATGTRERMTVRGTKRRSGPFRRFTSADGLPIYVGRNARENEELTFKLARSDDLWLHAHGTPGSHVVVRLEKGSAPPTETLKDAATLALLYSDLKKSGKGEVLYTRRKWVRKVKGRSPGTVTVTQEKTLFLTLDRARLDRLKARQREPHGQP